MRVEKWLDKSNLVWGVYALCVTSMVYSPFLLSISMILLILFGLINIEIQGEGRYKIAIGKLLFRQMIQIRKYPEILILTIFFFLVLFSFWPMNDVSYWLERVRIKLPFLLLPIIFLGLPKFKEEDLYRLVLFMLLLMLFSAIGIGIHYFNDYESINALIKEGHHMPTPRNHIRYSLLLAWAIVCGLYFWEQKIRMKSKRASYLIGTITILLILFIHFLSVKSGILLLYVGVFALTISTAFYRRKWLFSTVLLSVTLLLGILAFQLIPSLKNKVGYFKHDMVMFKEGRGGQYSDSGRLASLDVGWMIARENFWTGVGAGNLRLAVNEKYEQKYPDYVEAFMPQNQFLFVWASSGIIAFFIFLIVFFYPFIYQSNFRHPLLFSFGIMMFVICSIEHAMENAVGVAHFLIFQLLLLTMLRHHQID